MQQDGSAATGRERGDRTGARRPDGCAATGRVRGDRTGARRQGVWAVEDR
jgi:hypothetical protein